MNRHPKGQLVVGAVSPLAIQHSSKRSKVLFDATVGSQRGSMSLRSELGDVSKKEKEKKDMSYSLV